MTEQEIESVACEIAYTAYQRFGENPHKDTRYEEDSFPMLTYNRFARLIITGMNIEMLSNGFSLDEVREVLRSKQLRWLLDREEDTLIELGRKWAKDFNKMD